MHVNGKILQNKIIIWRYLPEAKFPCVHCTQNNNCFWMILFALKILWGAQKYLIRCCDDSYILIEHIIE